ncbi:MAG: glycosyltransferase family 4 protein [Anaerolineaceae bacterium]|jgi:UDP-N-acetylmuramyl pentapeptide phosphotransferase/UDP-N-acetylglucosamine-1-phosphate transferase|nr:glycosyltransferase family 4 protein [Anaerolineaceae bacterium]
MKELIAFLMLTASAYVGVEIVRKWLMKRQVIDLPNERSSHSVPTPRGGGLVIVIITLAVAFVSMLLAQNWKEGLVFVVVGSGVAWIGWQDDVKSLSPKLRFLLQGLAAVATLLGLGYFDAISIPLFGELHLGIIGIPITLLWTMGLINAYNFMDGIDGISGSVALTASLGWMLFLGLNGQFSSPIFWIALAIAASNLGFLGHNWSPARIFMGDVASTFLGFCFAVLPLLSVQKVEDAFLLGVIVMWAYILDTLITFLRRAIKREKVFSAHRTHLYQRLVISGYPVPTITSLYVLLTALGVILAYAWIQGYTFAPAAIIIGLPILWIILMGFTKYHENKS